MIPVTICGRKLKVSFSPPFLPFFLSLIIVLYHFLLLLIFSWVIYFLFSSFYLSTFFLSFISSFPFFLISFFPLIISIFPPGLHLTILPSFSYFSVSFYCYFNFSFFFPHLFLCSPLLSSLSHSSFLFLFSIYNMARFWNNNQGKTKIRSYFVIKNLISQEEGRWPKWN